MNIRCSATMAVLVGSVLAGCGGTSTTTPSPTQTPPPPASVTSGIPVDQAEFSGTGSFTWISISATRPLCEAITRQLGQSWPLWITMNANGNVVKLQLSEEPDLAEVAIFEGTREGDAISASRKNLNMTFACPQDTFGTPQTGGDMSAFLAGREISGTYTEVFGSGRAQVTATFNFHAGLAER
jgi:hypothetical protein